MKILQAVSLFYPALVFGGPVRVSYVISKELAKRGHEITVFTTDAYDRETRLKLGSSYDTVDGLRIEYFKNMIYDPRKNLFIAPELVRVVKREIRQFDVVHLHDYRSFLCLITTYYAKKCGVPYVLQAHGQLPRILTKQKSKWIFDVLFGNRLLSHASKVIALSLIEAEQYRSMGVPDEKTEVIPNGIDLSEYSDLPPKGSFKKKFSIDKDEKTILYLGRIHRIKGLDVLVKAFAKIVEKLDDVKLVVVGSDDGYLDELEALVRALKIEDNVLITDPLYSRDKLEAYVDADVYVLPSRYETFPMTILEAVACGTPIILTEYCGIAEHFRNKVGLVVKPDSKHLCEALLEILLNREKRDVFRENCDSMMERFDISKTVSKLEEVYEELVE